MAVDANVLIFERMREEVKNGRSTKDAAEAGFTEAWGTIVDSNLTTLGCGLRAVLFRHRSGQRLCGYAGHRYRDFNVYFRNRNQINHCQLA